MQEKQKIFAGPHDQWSFLPASEGFDLHWFDLHWLEIPCNPKDFVTASLVIQIPPEVPTGFFWGGHHLLRRFLDD